MKDLLDIVIIGLLIYTLVIFLRRTRAYLTLLGIAFTGSLYLLANSLDLSVTLLTLKYLVSVSLIIFVIIFQTEIKKYFEFLGLIGTRHIKMRSIDFRSLSITEILQSCVIMAQSKIGAIIVIQGNDDLGRFISGGIPLDGIVSEELILSIFDNHSEGHDGALIVANNRVLKFAAHLPLSTNFKEIGKHGTRHSAALGLSEVSDAFCLVVSEEKSQVSICRDAKLITVADFADLGTKLDSFIKDKFSPIRENIFFRFARHNFWIKVGAFSAAYLIWLIVKFSKYATIIQ
jgi:uncharacterized protein (TIGR00159 family)